MVKLIIELDTDIQFSFENSQKEIYNKYYKEKGWLYNEEAEAIYYEAELPFMPQEGQRLGTKNGISIVNYAIYEIEEEENASFFNRSRIVIHDE